MVDDSIDVDKLLIRTWHAFPADLREKRGHTWVTVEDDVDDTWVSEREGKTWVTKEGDLMAWTWAGSYLHGIVCDRLVDD